MGDTLGKPKTPALTKRTHSSLQGSAGVPLISSAELGCLDSQVPNAYVPLCSEATLASQHKAMGKTC